MQNKANFPDDQMNVNNVNKVLTKDYENISNWTLDENKANTNPNKANFKLRQKKPRNPAKLRLKWVFVFF